MPKADVKSKPKVEAAIDKYCTQVSRLFVFPVDKVCTERGAKRQYVRTPRSVRFVEEIKMLLTTIKITQANDERGDKPF